MTPETRRKVTREVRRLRPDAIVAPDPSRLWSGSGYVNHLSQGRGDACASAVMPDAPTRVMFQEPRGGGLEPFEVPTLYLSVEDPDTFVDIGETLEAEGAPRPRSQLGPEVDEWVTTRARDERAGCEFAEGFKAFRLQDDEEDRG